MNSADTKGDPDVSGFSRLLLLGICLPERHRGTPACRRSRLWWLHRHNILLQKPIFVARPRLFCILQIQFLHR